jgi:hypothetical protein
MPAPSTLVVILGLVWFGIALVIIALTNRLMRKEQRR